MSAITDDLAVGVVNAEASVDAHDECPEMDDDRGSDAGRKLTVDTAITRAVKEPRGRPSAKVVVDDRKGATAVENGGIPPIGDNGFGISKGTLQLVKISRKQWQQSAQFLPLALPPNQDAPILKEFTRSWRALRLKTNPSSASSEDQQQRGQTESSVLRNYEPKYTPGEATFPSDVSIPVFLEPRVAVEDAMLFLVSPTIKFSLGTIEPLFCRLVVYDVNLGCRVTEEFTFMTDGPQPPGSPTKRRRNHEPPPPRALMYTLPNHQSQHLYLVLKVSKVLLGDADVATAPYVSPEKFSSESEQVKLKDKASDCLYRLGRYRQPLAWGAISLLEGLKRPMTIYRQRTTMSDEQRLPFIPDAVRGTLKEKIMPSACEFDVERMEDNRASEARAAAAATLPSISTSRTDLSSPAPSSSPRRPQEPPPSPRLVVTDPFADARLSSSPESESSLLSSTYHATSSDTVACREVQPLCHPSMTPVYGLTGSGPVAVSYINCLYLFPTHVEKFPYRNIAIRVQLLDREVDFVCGIPDLETQTAVLQAVYGANHEVTTSAYTQVNYHQKNPQFEDEIKLCLPTTLTLTHHVLFSFYHVHCKKLQANQQQQELVAYAVLPLLDKHGTLLSDSPHVLNIVPAPAVSKASTTGGVISLPPKYVAAARESNVDNGKITFTCRTRALSSIYSQDAAIAAFLRPFQASSESPRATPSDNETEQTLLALKTANVPDVRFFFFSIVKFVLGYLRFGSPRVRRAAFRAFLSILEKASWTPHRTIKNQDAKNQILEHFVQLVFNEYAVEDPCAKILSPSHAGHNKDGPRAIFDSILVEWQRVLREQSTADDCVETKRLSLAYSGTLLRMLLKSIAKYLLQQQKPGGGMLPLTLRADHAALVESMILELANAVGDNSSGLLLQKEVNRSIGFFCRGLFLVVDNAVPARIIQQYIKWITSRKQDANVLVHILFPFLQIMTEFEYFAVVNGVADRDSKNTAPITRPWLAKLVLDQLINVIDGEKEDKLRSEALRLLRRMFVVQAYNPLYQRPDQQQALALMYFPFLQQLTQLTQDGKLLAPQANTSNNDLTQIIELKKEVLVCVAHLVSSVSDEYLPYFFHQAPADVHIIGPRDHQSDHDKRGCSSNSSNNEDDSDDDDDQRLSQCLLLVQQIIEVYLCDESVSGDGNGTSRRLSSPDLYVREGRGSLADLEQHLRNRRARHRVGLSANLSCLASESAASLARGAASSNAAGGGNNGNNSPRTTASPSLTESRQASQKSLPRTWAKTGAAANRRASSGKEDQTRNFLLESSRASFVGASTGCLLGNGGDVEDTTDYETHGRQLQVAIARTALRCIRVAIDEHEALIRQAERPLMIDRSSSTTTKRLASTDRAYAFLGRITDLLFTLLQQATLVETLSSATKTQAPEDERLQPNDTRDAGGEECFVVDVLGYFEAFLTRFQRPLFASRSVELPLMHDECRVDQLLVTGCRAKSSDARQEAAALLSELIRVCYEQTGCFLLVKRSMIKALSRYFFATTPPTFEIAALDQLFGMMETHKFRQQGPSCFEIQFTALIVELKDQVRVSDQWRRLMTPTCDGGSCPDHEVVQEGLDRIQRSISPLWLLEQKHQWLDALLQLHVAKDQLVEATCCKLYAVDCALQACQQPDDAWISQELRVALAHAERAGWFEKAVTIAEQLMALYKRRRDFTSYQDVVRQLQGLAGRVDPNDKADGDAFNFYRVAYDGPCIPRDDGEPPHEYIYKRSKFTTLGEFVSEIKASLQVQYAVCDKIEMVSELKPNASSTTSNVIWLRVVPVKEEIDAQAESVSTSGQPAVFRFATPFTLTGSGATSYGKTSEQMKRVTFLHVAMRFPCWLTRQRVHDRREEVRCPIENAMEDINKRCTLLQDEVNKERRGCTDLKTLTLVLKGSVDTHVHGGIPEVIDSFLVQRAAGKGHTDDGTAKTSCPAGTLELAYPVLLDRDGKPMNDATSTTKRVELANLLVQFLSLCFQGLVISRSAFHRASIIAQPGAPTSSAISNESNAGGGSAAPSGVTPVHGSPSKTLNAPQLLLSTAAIHSDNGIVAGLASQGTPQSQQTLSPLQVEFEKGFVALLAVMQTRVFCAYEKRAELMQLVQQAQHLRMGGQDAASSSSNAAAKQATSGSLT